MSLGNYNPSSVVVTDKIYAGGITAYTDYLEREKAGQTVERVGAFRVDIGTSPPGFAVEVERMLSGTRRKVWGEDVVISFSADRFDPADPTLGPQVLDAAEEVFRRAAPNSPLCLVAQRDNGRWHVHGIVPNLDLETGLARRGTWAHWQWRAIHDEVIQEQGFDPVQQGSAELSRVERLAARAGRALPSDEALLKTPPDEVPKNDLDGFLAAHVVEAVADGRLTELPAPGEPVEVALDGGHFLSVRRSQAGGLSFAVTDSDGAPVLCAPGKRGGKPARIARTDTALEKAHGRAGTEEIFTPAGLSAVIELSGEEEVNEHHTEARESSRKVGALEARAWAEVERAADLSAGTAAFELEQQPTRLGTGRPAAEPDAEVAITSRNGKAHGGLQRSDAVYSGDENRGSSRRVEGKPGEAPEAAAAFAGGPGGIRSGPGEDGLAACLTPGGDRPHEAVVVEREPC